MNSVQQLAVRFNQIVGEIKVRQEMIKTAVQLAQESKTRLDALNQELATLRAEFEAQQAKPVETTVEKVEEEVATDEQPKRRKKKAAK